MQYWVPAPDSLTTWANLAKATHMKTGQVSDPQVALKTLKLRAHACRICKDTKSLKAYNWSVYL